MNDQNLSLSKLLNAEEPLFSIAMRQLEEASGKPGVDAKLTADIVQKAHDRMRQMGLDPNDTNGPELYAALTAKAKEHDAHLAQQIGVSDPNDVAQAMEKGLEAARNSNIPKECWVLKKSVAKDFLRKMPPQGIMEILGYESVDSMLKTENISELFGALRFAESGDWLNEFNELYKSLTPSDFETREIELIQMSYEKWGDIAEHFIEKKRHFHTHSKEMGVIVIVPNNVKSMPGITMKVLSLTFHYYNEIRLYSAFFKLKQVQPDFGQVVVETLIADPGNQAIMAGQNVHWRVVQRYFGKLKDEFHPEVFQPHVQPEDLHWRHAEEAMYELAPELEFWKDMDYVALVHDGRPTTFNLMDVSLGFANEVAYQERYIYHFRESLWNEIFIRYMGQKTLEQQVLAQLDNDMIAPENL